jgi:sulfatase maturation enzyme AslB (radical SAM superfamily)
MQTSEILRAWSKILRGERPSLAIEITRECPLRCPGCYAYEAAHLGGGVTLRELNDRKGRALVDGVLEVVDRLKPLHLSIVGGAFRPLAREWATLPHVSGVVSIDGLQPEHDVRRKPATYDRILKNIAGQKITIHCTVTGQMMKRPGYLNDFLEFLDAATRD